MTDPSLFHEIDLQGEQFISGMDFGGVDSRDLELDFSEVVDGDICGGWGRFH